MKNAWTPTEEALETLKKENKDDTYCLVCKEMYASAYNLERHLRTNKHKKNAKRK